MLAALVKAFGIAGYVDGAFYDMVSEYVEQNIRNLGPQHLAEIAFGANAGGCVTERMQNAIEKVASDYVEQADMRVRLLLRHASCFKQRLDSLGIGVGKQHAAQPCHVKPA